jgi:hypothetical protein
LSIDWFYTKITFSLGEALRSGEEEDVLKTGEKLETA